MAFEELLVGNSYDVDVAYDDEDNDYYEDEKGHIYTKDERDLIDGMFGGDSDAYDNWNDD